MSFTTVYGLFAITSILLFNCLIVMARYVQQTKKPPADEEFDRVVEDKRQLEIALETQKQETAEAENRFKAVQEKLQKSEDTLQAKLTELQALQSKQASAAPPS